MENLPSEIEALYARNTRVETEKAWETSLTRRLSIAVCTYLTACLFLWWIGSTPVLLQALVPTGGYALSTLSLPWIKAVWIKRHHL